MNAGNARVTVLRRKPDPVLGEKMQRIVEKVLSTPKDVAGKAKSLLE